ncbi:hypothetical protein MP228_008478 [Amoeboaphelidium protococcarum]|nr:hypothetical protein MP228_008478 [Amoeboaphelidium protococcarum]
MGDQVEEPQQKPAKKQFGSKPSDLCDKCQKVVYPVEKLQLKKAILHRNCLRCQICNKILDLSTYAAVDGKYFCKPHFTQLFNVNGDYTTGFQQVESRKLQQQQQQALSNDTPIVSTAETIDATLLYQQSNSAAQQAERLSSGGKVNKAQIIDVDTVGQSSTAIDKATDLLNRKKTVRDVTRAFEQHEEKAVKEMNGQLPDEVYDETGAVMYKEKIKMDGVQGDGLKRTQSWDQLRQMVEKTEGAKFKQSRAALNGGSDPQEKEPETEQEVAAKEEAKKQVELKRAKTFHAIKQAQPVELCVACQKRVYPAEKLLVDKQIMHTECLKCAECIKKLTLATYNSWDGQYYCKAHFNKIDKTKVSTRKSNQALNVLVNDGNTPEIVAQFNTVTQVVSREIDLPEKSFTETSNASVTQVSLGQDVDQSLSEDQEEVYSSLTALQQHHKVAQSQLKVSVLTNEESDGDILYDGDGIIPQSASLTPSDKLKVISNFLDSQKSGNDGTVRGESKMSSNNTAAMSNDRIDKDLPQIPIQPTSKSRSYGHLNPLMHSFRNSLIQLGQSLNPITDRNPQQSTSNVFKAVQKRVHRFTVKDRMNTTALMEKIGFEFQVHEDWTVRHLRRKYVAQVVSVPQPLFDIELDINGNIQDNMNSNGSISANDSLCVGDVLMEVNGRNLEGLSQSGVCGVFTEILKPLDHRQTFSETPVQSPDSTDIDRIALPSELLVDKNLVILNMVVYSKKAAQTLSYTASAEQLRYTEVKLKRCDPKNILEVDNAQRTDVDMKAYKAKQSAANSKDLVQRVSLDYGPEYFTFDVDVQNDILYFYEKQAHKLYKVPFGYPQSLVISKIKKLPSEMIRDLALSANNAGDTQLSLHKLLPPIYKVVEGELRLGDQIWKWDADVVSMSVPENFNNKLDNWISLSEDKRRQMAEGVKKFGVNLVKNSTIDQEHTIGVVSLNKLHPNFKQAITRQQ